MLEKEEEEKEVSLPKAVSINKASSLPEAAYKTMFLNERMVFNGVLLQTGIIKGRNKKLLRAIKVGDYLYIEQEKFEDTHWAEMARKGHNVMWIVHHPSAKLVGKVVDGEVTQI